MKIMFLVSSMGGGGAEKVVSTLSNYLVSKQHEISILMISTEKNESFYKLDPKVKLIPLLQKKNNHFLWFSKIKKIKTNIHQAMPDVVVSFLPHVCIYTWLALRKTNFRYILSERNDPNQMNLLYKFLCKKAFRDANGCVFQTKDAASFYNIDRLKKYKIIENPINLTNFKPNLCGVTNKRIVSVGRLTKQKNFELLINSFADFMDLKGRDYTLNIYGDGPLRSKLQKTINDKKMEKNVFLCGKSTEWHNIEQNSALFVSSSNYEGMPNALAEALLIGLPCIATDCPVGGSKTLAEHFERCYLVPTNDRTKLTNTMLKVIEKKHPREMEINHFSIELISEKWVSFFEEVIK